MHTGLSHLRSRKSGLSHSYPHTRAHPRAGMLPHMRAHAHTQSHQHTHWHVHTMPMCTHVHRLAHMHTHPAHAPSLPLALVPRPAPQAEDGLPCPTRGPGLKLHSPMKDTALVLMIPLGSRWKSYSLPSTTTVWPALLPPWEQKPAEWPGAWAWPPWEVLPSAQPRSGPVLTAGDSGMPLGCSGSSVPTTHTWTWPVWPSAQLPGKQGLFHHPDCPGGT